MLRCSLALGVILLFVSVALAQHSSGGGSSGGSSGGGGSHASSSGGSSSSGSHSGSSSGSSASSHSSGGSVSHGSSGHGSGSGSATSHSGARGAESNALHSIHAPDAGARTKTGSPEKRNFFSFLRHPIGKPKPKPEPEPKPVANLRHWICVHGPCPVCPAGQARSGGGCGGTVVANRTHNFCSRQAFANGGSCLLQIRFLDDCGGLRMAMDRQERSMRAAESAQQSACAMGPTQECSDLTRTGQSESGLYRELQDRYRLCRQRSISAYPLSGYGFARPSLGLFSDPLGIGLDHP